MRLNRTECKIVASGVSLALLLFSQTPAMAGDECVNVGGTGGCFAVIQDAIDATVNGAGDTVTIEEGVFFQRFIVDKDDLTVEGEDQDDVIIDPDRPANANNGGGGLDAIQVTADDVTLKKFTVRNGRADGIQVFGSAVRTLIKKVTVTGPNSDCLNIDGDFTTVEKVELFGCGSNAIDVDANDFTLRESEIGNCDSRCVDVDGDRAVIAKNDVSVAEDGDCIEVDGDFAVVEDNDTRSCDGNGVDVRGENPIVYGNTTTALDSDGYNIDCIPCTGGKVSHNKAVDIPDDDGGFDIFAAAPGGLVVEDNEAKRTADEGFRIAGTGIVLRNNEAKDNGGDRGESGFQIRGTGHTVVGNESRRNHDDGFDIGGRGHIVYHNVAKENREDGFDVRADTGFAIALTDNEAEDNNATGFEVNGIGVVTLTDNESDNNRQAFCDSGGATVDGGGNDFAVPGGVVACDAID